MSSILRADSLFFREELRGISLALEARRFTLFSGEGAASLLRLLSLLERPDSGEVWVDSQPAGALDEAGRVALRNHTFGFVFAEPFLLDSFTVAENVAMPLFKITGIDIEQARNRTAQILEFGGLAGMADVGIIDLSMLDQYKVSLVRALAISPQVIIAEGAGLHLESDELAEFGALLRSVPETLGITVLATSSAGQNVDRVIQLENGLIVADSNPVAIQEAPAHD